jgi:hypothetical protein
VLVEEPFGRADVIEAEIEADNEIEMDVAPSASAVREHHADLGDVMLIDDETQQPSAPGPVDFADMQAGDDVGFNPLAALEADVQAFSVEDPAPADEVAEAIESEKNELREATDATPSMRERLQLVHSSGEVEAAVSKVRGGQELSPEEAAKALDALQRMSVEERTRLFS